MQTKSKFPIGWLFAIIAAACIGVLTFFSANFLYKGEQVGINIAFAMGIAVVLLLIVYLLKQVKSVSIPLNFRKAAITEALLLLAFMVVVFVSVITTNHFYAVMNRKDTIQKEVKTQIKQMDGMFASYNRNVSDRVDAYDKELESIEKNKDNNYNAYVNAGLHQISRRDLVVELQSNISCGNMQSQIEEWEGEMESKTTGLGLIRLMPRIPEIDKTLKNTLDTLIEKDHSSDLGLNGPHWNYTLSVGNDIMRHFAKEDGEGLTLWAFLVAIIAAFIMLLPYIAAERDGRSKGLIGELRHERKNRGI